MRKKNADITTEDDVTEEMRKLESKGVQTLAADLVPRICDTRLFVFFIDKVSKMNGYNIGKVYPAISGSPYLSRLILAKRSEIRFLTGITSKICEYCDNKEARRVLFMALCSNSLFGECKAILKSIRISDEYLEFVTLFNQLLPNISNDKSMLKELFLHIFNSSMVMPPDQAKQVQRLAVSFINLLPHKSLHPVFKQFIPELQSTMIDKSLSLEHVPPLMRAFYLEELFRNTRSTKEEVYNFILGLPEYRLIDLLEYLPVDVSIPFYFKSDSHYQELHKAISKAFASGEYEVAVMALKKMMNRSPEFVKEHIEEISNTEFHHISGLLAMMVKANIIDFSKIWDTVKSKSIDHNLVKEGVSQMIRNRSSPMFILNHYFPGVNDVNWSAVGKEFPESYEIASLVLQSGTSDAKISESLRLLMKWRKNLLSKIRTAPSFSHRSLALPVLMVSTQGEVFQYTKTALSQLPLCDNEFIYAFSAYTLFNYAKSVITMDNGIRKLDELFNLSIITPYSIFAYTAIVSVLKSDEYMNRLKELSKSTSHAVQKAVCFANEILRSSEESNEENKYMSVINSLIHNTQLKVALPPNELAYYNAMKSCFTMSIDDIVALINKDRFSSQLGLQIHMIQTAFAYCINEPHAIATNSSVVEKCVHLIESGDSRISSFGVKALSQSSKKSYDISALIGKGFDDSLLFLSYKQGDVGMMEKVLKSSEDISIILAIRPVLNLLSSGILKEFIERSLPKASIEKIYEILPILNDQTHIVIVLEEIRKRNSFFDGEAIKEACTKLNKESIKQFIKGPIDNLGLYCCDRSPEHICKLIASSDKWSASTIFTFRLNDKKLLLSYIEMLFVLVQSEKDVDSIIIAISAFLLARERSPVFTPIREYYQLHPSELTKSTLCLLAPSLIMGYNIKPEHYKALRNKKISPELAEALSLKLHL